MRKLQLGVLLILMMFGHNFVLNQTQTMQSQLQKIHRITVTEFNLLYSIPSAISILFIIPMGFFYEKYEGILLWTGAIALSLGQLLTAIFSSEHRDYYFGLMMSGRVFEGIGAEILYMIQGNMASSWMGKYAGVVFILPEVGEIANVFITPLTFKHWGVRQSFLLGFFVCLVSTVACFFVYFGLKKRRSKNEQSKGVQIQMTSSECQTQSKPKLTNDSQHLERTLSEEEDPQRKHHIFEASKVYWLVTILCGINECLYFPFLDNINELISDRFCIPFEDTGYYLSIPFISAMFTSALSSLIIPKFERSKLILWTSVIPLIGHSIIYSDFDCDLNGETSFGKFILILGFIFFGMGIGSYYSVSFSAVGLSIPQPIRGMGYACMGFFQTIALTLIPIASGYIVESEEKVTNRSLGYKESSLLFIILCLSGVVVSFLIYRLADEHSFIYNDEDELEGDEECEKFTVEGVAEIKI